MLLAKTKGKVEVYQAIQGEGSTLGMPTIFVRTSTCNLMCSWCDTFYTWNFSEIKRKNPHERCRAVSRTKFQVDMTPREVAIEIKKIIGNHRNVLFTGGEPTLQQIQIVEVMKILQEDGEKWFFQIETNGTLFITNELADRLSMINCSPKLESSGNLLQLRDKPPMIERMLDIYRSKPCNLCFKFVIRQKYLSSDLNEIDRWRIKNKVPKNLIWLMPEGISTRDIIKGTKALVSICQKEGYNLSTRLQVILFNKKRAV